MSPFLSSCKARRLWLLALLLTSPAGVPQVPSHAATIGTPGAVNFAPQILDLQCTFAPGADGALGINTGKTQIGTEATNGLTGGSRASVDVFANFSNAQLVLDTLSVTKDSTAYVPVSSTLFLSKVGTNVDSASGSVSLEIGASVTEAITAGAVFSPEAGKATFDAGEYDAQLTLTCTTGGVK